MDSFSATSTATTTNTATAGIHPSPTIHQAASPRLRHQEHHQQQQHRQQQNQQQRQQNQRHRQHQQQEQQQPKDIASAIISYQRKQSRKGTSSSVADGASEAGGSRSGKSRNRSARGPGGGGGGSSSHGHDASPRKQQQQQSASGGIGGGPGAGSVLNIAHAHPSTGSVLSGTGTGAGGSTAGASINSASQLGTTGEQPPVAPARTLFDPRRHDPVRFAMSKRAGLISLAHLPPSQSVTSSNNTSAGGGGGGGGGGIHHHSHHHHHPNHHHHPHHHHHHGGGGGGGPGSSSFIDGSVTTAATTLPSVSTASPSVTSSEASRERRRRRAPSSRSANANNAAAAGSESGAGSEVGGASGASGSFRPGGELAASGAGTGGPEDNAYFGQIKRMYRELTILETHLKEFHANAAAANAAANAATAGGASAGSASVAAATASGSVGRAGGAGINLVGDGSNTGSINAAKSVGIAQRSSSHLPGSTSMSSSISSMDPSARPDGGVGADNTTLAEATGGTAGGATDDGVDHAYWNNLAAQHKHLAEMHAAFLEASWRPNLPTSFAVLPIKYNSPVRLWSTAFHLFLERIRQALPFSQSHGPAPGDTRGAAKQAALLDLFEEFIYFAYGYYSNLHEAETFVKGRSEWMERLGDLARYRFGVAGLRMGLASWEARERERERHVAREAPDSPGLTALERKEQRKRTQRHLMALAEVGNEQSGADLKKKQKKHRKDPREARIDDDDVDQEGGSDVEDAEGSVVDDGDDDDDVEEPDLAGDEADSADEVGPGPRSGPVRKPSKREGGGRHRHHPHHHHHHDPQHHHDPLGPDHEHSHGHHCHGHRHAHHPHPHHHHHHAHGAEGDHHSHDYQHGAGEHRVRREERVAGMGRAFEAPSIGEAALGDWELEEKETWRETARGWYARGLGEVPGAGRLHNHLGLLCRHREDLKRLYHSTKSLTTFHPYEYTREAMAPMCAQDRQLRRIQPGAPASDLFTHLHVMILTRVDLDNFEDVFGRYKESIKTALLASTTATSHASLNRAIDGSGGQGRVAVEGTALDPSNRSTSNLSDDAESGGDNVISETEWMMYATVCIAGLLQYGAADALLTAPPTTSNTTSERQDGSSHHRAPKGKITQKVKSHTPTAIMLNKDAAVAATAGSASGTSMNPSSSRSPAKGHVSLPNPEEGADGVEDVDGENEQDGGGADDDGASNQPTNTIVSLQQPAFDPSSIPLTFVYSARVAFDTLEIVIRHGGASPAPTSTMSPPTMLPNPFITMMLTFLLTIFKQANALAILERWVPWRAVADLANGGPDAGSNSTTGTGSTGAPTSSAGTTSAGYGIVPPASSLADIPSKVTGGVPLPEDWCLRGMSWVNRRVYERGFWNKKPHPDRADSRVPTFDSEIDVLDRGEIVGAWSSRPQESLLGGEFSAEVSPGGVINGVAGGGVPGGPGPISQADAVSVAFNEPLAHLRWVRIAYAIGNLARTVPGLDARQPKKNGKTSLIIVPPLATKMAEWKAEEEALRMVEEKRKVKTLVEEEPGWDDEEFASDESSDDENDASLTEAVRELKARRRALKKALRDSMSSTRSLPHPKREPRKGKKVPNAPAAKTTPARQAAARALHALPGYTILVLDTNILLTPAGNLLAMLVESKRWTVVLPLAVITELDGLSKNRNQVGDAAKAALNYIERSLRTHSKWLKIQTSRGNYLYNLNIRFEHIDFAGLSSEIGEDGHPAPPIGSSAGYMAHNQLKKTVQARNLDEIILRAAVWQEEHFVNRIPIIFSDASSAAERDAAMSQIEPQTAKVVLITLDINLRIKARARGIKAASDVEVLDVVIGSEARPNG
ncbi:hypothetical protein OC845_002777 [Tilletia horrida]|nr:hypothetical protein OC845_002777 [Tilletia horrida]